MDPTVPVRWFLNFPFVHEFNLYKVNLSRLRTCWQNRMVAVLELEMGQLWLVRSPNT